MRAVFDHAEEHASHLHSYWFRPDAKLRFTPGEYTELHIPHNPHDSRGEKRKFTISSSPADPLIRLTITLADNGSSFKSALAGLQPGDSVYMAETMGEFVLPKDASIPLTFIAAGAVVTPVMSIIAWLHATNEQRAVQIIHTASKASTLLEQELFKNYAKAYIPIVTQPGPNWHGLTGSLTATRILELIKNPTAQRYYLSGPETMISVLGKQLTASGISPDNIVIDLFLGVPDEK